MLKDAEGCCDVMNPQFNLSREGTQREKREVELVTRFQLSEDEK